MIRRLAFLGLLGLSTCIFPEELVAPMGTVRGAFAYVDSAGKWQVDEEGVALVPASGGYAYSLKLTPRTYYALATINEDGDEEYFEEGERVGFWRDATTVEPIPLSKDQMVSGINFTLVPYTSEE